MVQIAGWPYVPLSFDASGNRLGSGPIRPTGTTDLVVISHDSPPKDCRLLLYSYGIYAKCQEHKGYEIMQFLGGSCDIVGLRNFFHDAHLPRPDTIAWQPITEQQFKNLRNYGEMPQAI